jgi:putative transposase
VIRGIEAISPKPRLSRPGAAQQHYPYLLRDLLIQQANQVWSTDSTFVRMRRGFLYLVAILDWYSRYVLSWELSNTLDGAFCLSALEQALAQARPEIFNTDQGATVHQGGLHEALRSRRHSLGADERWIMSLWNGSGGRSSMKKFSM